MSLETERQPVHGRHDVTVIPRAVKSHITDPADKLLSGGLIGKWDLWVWVV